MNKTLMPTHSAVRSPRWGLLASWVLIAAHLLSLSNANGLAGEPVDFAKTILPLLSDRCALCHGPDPEGRQADFRVDTPDLLAAKSQNGGLEHILLPGNPDASELYRRITSADPDEVMPPPDANLSLTAAEIAQIGLWIEQGANWAQHWSLRPIERPLAPPSPTEEASPTANPIDPFVQSLWQTEGLVATPPADRYTLLRRLKLDLLGLPPNEEEVALFLQDASPLAYERLVDRLLASPEFGERMATPWLDAARYADTYGYQSDVYREVWPWRDWVVEAFRESMPYDQFLTWQLAGDLIPHPSRESRLATAFNRLHRQTNEGGSVEEEFRAEYVADRVNTLGTAILGLTLECARCHDHKYDPISQQQYYQLAAFFSNIDEAGLYSHFTNFVPPPVLDLPSHDQSLALQEALAAVQRASDDYQVAVQRAATATANSLAAAANPILQFDGDELARIPDEVARYDFDTSDSSADASTPDYTNRIATGPAAQTIGQPQAIVASSTTDGKTSNPLQSLNTALELDGENGLQTTVGGDWDWWQPFTVSLRLRPQIHHDRAVIWHRSKAWTDAASCGYELLLEDGKLSAALIHFWPGDAVRVRTLAPLPLQQWSHVAVTSDGSGQAAGLKIYVDGIEAAVEVIRDNLVRTIRGGGANEFTVGNRFRDRGFKAGQLDDLRLFARDLDPLEHSIIAHQAGVASIDIDALGADPASRFRAYAHGRDVAMVEARRQLKEARQRLAVIRDSIPAIMTMNEVAGLHKTYILRRGQYDAPEAEVTADVPDSLAPFADDMPRNRLGLAQWLTDSAPERRHPLVARVAVNRIWQSFFEQGLVSTPEDFGLQGQPPSHPALLDFLAASFIEQGWDTKRLIRLIVTSDAYRRSAHCSPEQRELDPENRFLARGPAARLPVETIRDCALAISGLLDTTSGGPPVRPYQPPGLWEEKSGAAYHRQEGAGSHRRSLYTIWKRTSPPPAMVLFDAPGREVCVAGRTTTQTPLQALVLLNDEQFVEAARGTAFLLLSSSAHDSSARPDASDLLTQRVQALFQKVLVRPASDAESTVVADLVQAQLAYFAENPTATNEYLSIGDFQWQPLVTGAQCSAAELAAWSIVAQTLMNLQEWVSQ